MRVLLRLARSLLYTPAPVVKEASAASPTRLLCHSGLSEGPRRRSGRGMQERHHGVCAIGGSNGTFEGRQHDANSGLAGLAQERCACNP